MALKGANWRKSATNSTSFGVLRAGPISQGVAHEVVHGLLGFARLPIDRLRMRMLGPHAGDHPDLDHVTHGYSLVRRPEGSMGTASDSPWGTKEWGKVT